MLAFFHDRFVRVKYSGRIIGVEDVSGVADEGGCFAAVSITQENDLDWGSGGVVLDFRELRELFGGCYFLGLLWLFGLFGFRLGLFLWVWLFGLFGVR
jgi:hypothetical protein